MKTLGQVGPRAVGERVNSSNVKNERTNVPISFWNETKTFWYGIIPEFVLLKTDCFDLVKNLLSWTKQK